MVIRYKMINVKFYSYVIISLVSFSRLEASGIIFTSPLKTKALFTSIDNVISTLEKYINFQENRLETLQSSLDEWKKEHNRITEDVETQLSNYLSQFNYLYMLKTRWTSWQNEMKNNTAAEYISEMKKNNNMTWPSDENIFGIMDSIINLQNIYHMEADSFAQGILNGVSTNTSLNYEECLMMTERCFETIHYKLALQWAMVTKKKYFTEGIENEHQMSKLLYYISYTSHVTGNDDLALESIVSYLEKNPHDEKAKAIQRAIRLRHPEKLEKTMIRKMEISRQMKDLCKKTTTQEELSRNIDLRCRYNQQNSPFLKIAPLREEFLSFNPPLILFRNAMYDSEIDNLKDISKNKLREISTTKGSDSHHNSFKATNFENDKNANIRRLSRRVEDMTTLRTSPKNWFQLHKYTVGGSSVHETKEEDYEYFDDDQLVSFFQNEEDYEDYDEEITSTVLFHMNNVIQGGSTTFPRLNITVKAEKGDALVWYETAHSQSSDLPEYSSCSVIAGQKWTLMTRISN